MQRVTGMEAGGGSGDAYQLLRDTLSSVFSDALYVKTSLHEDVCRYVHDLKCRGLSAETVSTIIKMLVLESAGEQKAAERTEALLAKMVDWCLEEYYRETA